MKAKCHKEMKVLFDASTTVRKAIHKYKWWEFTWTLEDVIDDVVLEELYWFSMWPIKGHKTDRLCKEKTEDMKKSAVSLCQTAISSCLTQRQTSKRKSKTLHLSREMLQQLTIGLAVHQLT